MINVKRKTEYWNAFMYGSSEVICLKHKKLEKAKKSKEKCEKQGGAIHRILKVTEVVGYKRRK